MLVHENHIFLFHSFVVLLQGNCSVVRCEFDLKNVDIIFYRKNLLMKELSFPQTLIF